MSREAAKSFYVVLANGATDTWVRVATVAAHSAEAAIRKAAQDESTGTFVAVPERSFKPLTVAVETQRRVRVAPASPAEEQQ